MNCDRFQQRTNLRRITFESLAALIDQTKTHLLPFLAKNEDVFPIGYRAQILTDGSEDSIDQHSSISKEIKVSGQPGWSKRRFQPLGNRTAYQSARNMKVLRKGAKNSNALVEQRKRKE